MAGLPYIQFFPASYLADTAHLTTLEHGAYFLLLLNYWQRGKPLLDLNSRLANVTRLSNSEWETVRPVLEEFFLIRDGVWIHERMERDLNDVLDKIEKKKKAGLASGKARKNNKRTPVKRVSNKKGTIRLDNITLDNKRLDNKKKPPTLYEVQDYIKEKGYRVDAQEFIDYYEANDWKDAEGKPVRSWKQKMIAVWSKDRYGTKSEPVKLCVVDKRPGVKFQLNKKNEKVWLCQGCVELMRGLAWGNMEPSRIEKEIEARAAHKKEIGHKRDDHDWREDVFD